MTLFGFVRRFGLLLLVAALLVAAVATGAWRWISFGQLQAHHGQLKHLVGQSPALSAVLFFALLVLVITACIPGPGIMLTASGYLFGTLLGGLISLAACVVGSALVFLACRGALADWVARRSNRRIRDLKRALTRDAFPHLLTLKLIPVLPFFVSNVAAGLAGVRLRTLVGATALGSAPVCFILSGLGAGLGRALDQEVSPGYRTWERPDILAPLIGLSILSAVAIIWRLVSRPRP